MLVRPLTRTASRRSSTYSHLLRPISPVGFFTANTASHPAISKSLAATAPFSSSATAPLGSSPTRNEPSVPIISWSAHKRSEHEIQVREEQTGEVVKPLEGDLQRPARPLDAQAFEALSPTLSNFTLREKVAVVTG